MKKSLFPFILCVLIIAGCNSTQQPTTTINDVSTEDIAELEAEIEAELDALEQELEAEFNATTTISDEINMDEFDLDTNMQLDENDVLVGGDAVATVTPGEFSATIIGGNFYYDVPEIRVTEGDEVTLTLRSAEGTHDFVIDELNVQSEVIKTDGETTFTFIADKAGSFNYYCSIGSHRANGMEGLLIVEPAA